MDFIDSDEEEEQQNVCSSSEHRQDNQALTNALFVCCMRLKPSQRATKSVHYHTHPEVATPSLTSMLWSDSEVVIPRHLLLLCSAEQQEVAQLLSSRLLSAKFQHVTIVALDENPSSSNQKYDAVVLLSAGMDQKLQRVMSDHLVAGGSALLHVDSGVDCTALFDPYYWVTDEQHLQNVVGKDQGTIVMLRKRAVLCNETGAIYWTRNVRRLAEERRLLELVSVPISVAEQLAGVLSDASHARAVNNMLEYGVCIFPGMFDRGECQEWGKKAMDDMKLLLGLLKTKKNIDLLHPETVDGKHVKVDNFHELSMREALRCDIRNVPNLKAKLESLDYNTNEWPSYHKVNNKSCAKNPSSLTIPPSKNVRFHPGLLSVLHDSMNPKAPDPTDEMGNWGRWNFEGPGPEAPNPIRIGRPGFIFSFPGCSDQTIHADTPHVFVHEHLPPHYINLFLGTHENARNLTKELLVDESKPREPNNLLKGFPVTMTSFVVGSQKLKTSAKIMNQEGGQEELEARLIRPQLDVGDALLFDCRILHFGLANESDIKSEKGEEARTDAWRPMMYINYHHTWFHDPKNWNDAEKIIS